MATKKTPAAPAPKPAPKAPHTSKGNVKIDLAARPASEVIDSTAKVVRKDTPAKPVRHDPFALPDLPELPDLDASLPSLNMHDPVEEAAAQERVFGPDLDESPIDPDLDDDVENGDMSHEDAENERLAQLHAGFRERAKQEAKRFMLATDSEYWFTVVFQDRDQKEQFLRGAGWEHLGDKYIDGEGLAEHMGVAVDKSEVVYNIGGADPKLAALVGIDSDYGSESNNDKRRKGKRR